MESGRIMNSAYIFGSGGFSKELLQLALDCDVDIDAFIGEKNGHIDEYQVINELEFNPHNSFDAYIAIGSPKIRKSLIDKLIVKFEGKIKFPNLIHPSARIMGLKNQKNVQIGFGNIFTANCIITSHVKIGNFCHFNLNTTIGHDTEIGDYFTSAPGVNISGNNKIGNFTYFGTNSCTREKVEITDHVIVGAGAAVVSNINESGTYVGVPAKKIKQGI